MSTEKSVLRIKCRMKVYFVNSFMGLVSWIGVNTQSAAAEQLAVNIEVRVYAALLLERVASSQPGRAVITSEAEAHLSICRPVFSAAGHPLCCSRADSGLAEAAQKPSLRNAPYSRPAGAARPKAR